MATKSPSVTKKPGKKSLSVTKESPVAPAAVPKPSDRAAPHAAVNPSDQKSDRKTMTSTIGDNHPIISEAVTDSPQTTTSLPTQQEQPAPRSPEDPFRELFGIPLIEACGENSTSSDTPATPEANPGRVVLMARNPTSAYVYWHLSATGIPGGAQPLVLRLYEDYPGPGTGESRVLHEIDANAPHASSYFDSLVGDGRYHAELGTRSPDGHFTCLFKSNPATTPRDAQTVVHRVNHTVEFGVSETEVRSYYRELMASLNPHRRRRIANRTARESRDSSDQTDVLSSWVLGGSEQNPHPSPTTFIDVQAELVVYGRTQAGTQLKLEGQPITVREDGTFSLRLALPPGELKLPFVAHNEGGESHGVALTLAYSKQEITG